MTNREFKEKVRWITNRLYNSDFRNCPFTISYDGITECVGYGTDSHYQRRKVIMGPNTLDFTYTNKPEDIAYDELKENVEIQLKLAIKSFEYYKEEITKQILNENNRITN